MGICLQSAYLLGLFGTETFARLFYWNLCLAFLCPLKGHERGERQNNSWSYFI